jgi:hypothetical protein
VVNVWTQGRGNNEGSLLLFIQYNLGNHIKEAALACTCQVKVCDVSVIILRDSHVLGIIIDIEVSGHLRGQDRDCGVILRYMHIIVLFTWYLPEFSHQGGYNRLKIFHT